MLFLLEIFLTIILIFLLKGLLVVQKIYTLVFYFIGILLVVGGFYGTMGSLSFLGFQWFFYTPLIIFSLLLLIVKMRESITLEYKEKGNFKLKHFNVIQISKTGKKIPIFWKDHGCFFLIYTSIIVLCFILTNIQILIHFFSGKHFFSNEVVLLFLVALVLFAVGLFGYITHKNLLINALSAILMYNGASLNFFAQEKLISNMNMSIDGTNIGVRNIFVFLIIITSMVMGLINFSFLMNYFDLKKNLFLDDADSFKN